MIYPYRIRTRLGWCFPHTNEANVSPSLLPGTLLSLHNPLPETRETGTALIVRPIATSPYIPTVEGKPLEVKEILPYVGSIVGKTPEGMPIILGEPVTEDEVPYDALKTTMAIEIPGHSPITPAVAVALIIAVAATLITITIALTVREMEINRRHALDLAMQSQKIVKQDYIDVNGDGISDVEVRTFGNGHVIEIALNEVGYKFIGGSARTIKEGLKFDDLYKDIYGKAEWWKSLVTYGIIAAIAIGGIYVAVKLITKKSKEPEDAEYVELSEDSLSEEIYNKHKEAIDGIWKKTKETGHEFEIGVCGSTTTEPIEGTAKSVDGRVEQTLASCTGIKGSVHTHPSGIAKLSKADIEKFKQMGHDFMCAVYKEGGLVCVSKEMASKGHEGESGEHSGNPDFSEIEKKALSEIITPSECCSGEEHICFVCYKPFKVKEAKTCEKCGWLKCSEGHCACSLSSEEKTELERLWKERCEEKCSF
ncbi:MAG: hypothetical protein AB1420_16015 [Bacillota bacterium]